MEQQHTGPEIKSTPFMSPMQQFGSSIIHMTNPDNELYKMELTFRSMRLNKDGEAIASGDPLMNDYGINSVIGTIQSIVNQVTIMSNLNKDEVPTLMDFLGDTLAKDLMLNLKSYGIKSVAARDKIYFTALSTSFITLKRAYEEGDKRFWKGSVQEIRTTSQQEGKSGLLSSLNPFK